MADEIERALRRSSKEIREHVRKLKAAGGPKAKTIVVGVGSAIKAVDGARTGYVHMRGGVHNRAFHWLHREIMSRSPRDTGKLRRSWTRVETKTNKGFNINVSPKPTLYNPGKLSANHPNRTAADAAYYIHTGAPTARHTIPRQWIDRASRHASGSFYIRVGRSKKAGGMGRKSFIDVSFEKFSNEIDQIIENYRV